MSTLSCVFYKGFRIMSGKGEAHLAPWDRHGELRFRFVVTVKAPNKERARFSYWSSVVDFLEDRDRLDGVRLRWAFRSFLEDARLGASDFRSFREELAAEDISDTHLRWCYLACRRAYRSCLRLEIPIEDPEFLRDLDADTEDDLIDAVQAVVFQAGPAKQRCAPCTLTRQPVSHFGHLGV